MSEARLELARKSVRAWQKRDVEWFIENTTPDFEFVPAILTTVEGEGSAVRGPENIREFFATLDEPWESFVIEEGEYREVAEQVICVVRLRAKGRGSGLEMDSPVAMVLWFSDDKMARAQSFLDVGDAIEAAHKELAV
jgi:ketosteroid isomerase-like protein